MSEDEIARIRAASPGGLAPPETEAEAMRRLALSQGLAPSAEVLLETEALHTVENAVNVRQMLEARPDVRRLHIVTSAFHMPRVRRTFELIFEDSPLELAFHDSPDAG